MVKYLQMDGVDDTFRTPSITFNSFEIDTVLRQKSGVLQIYYDFRSGFSFTYLQRETNGNDYAPQHTHYVNGVQVGNNGSPFIPSNERIILKAVFNSTATDDANIFSNNGGNGAYMTGDIYSIKFYNSTTLVAHYDMSTGTVQDQSGNGNHATLVGGTWVDDRTGEEPPPNGETIDAGDITISASSAFTAQANRILNADSDLQANTNLTALANRILNADSLLSASTSLTAEGEVISLELSVNMSVGSSLTAQGTRIINGDSNLSAESFLTAEGEVLTLELFVNMNASSNLSVEANRIVHADAVLSAHGEVLASGTAIYNGEAIFIATSDLTVHTGEELIGTIQLQGKRVLNVYLVAKRDLIVNLKGGLYVTAKNQNFSMVQGDTKYIQFPVDGVDNLAGCTVKWGVKKRESSTEYELFKDEFIIVDGQVQIKLESVDTLELLGTYYHETELTDQLGNVSTVLKGMVQVNKGIVQ